MRRSADTLTPRGPRAVAGVIVVAILAASLLELKLFRASLRERATGDLLAAADLKLEEIVHWREERLSSGRSIAASPFVARTVWRAQQGSASARADLLRWCSSALQHDEYDAVVAFGADGEKLAFAGPAAAGVAEGEYAAQIVHEGRVFLTDVHPDEHGSFHADVLVPLRHGSRIVGHVVIRISLDPHLAPALSGWPERSRTSEVLLVQRTGGDPMRVLVVSVRDGGSVAGPVPLERADLPVLRAGRGESGLLEGVDRHGHPVLMAARAVPQSDWVIAVEMDESDVFAPLRERAVWLLLLGAALAAAVVAVTVIWWRSQLDTFLQHRHEEQLRRLALERHFAHVIQYTNDIVMLLDDRLHVVEVNDRALEAYGYAREDLLARDVRDLLTPKSRVGLEQQLRAIPTGTGKVFETKHVRRDGTTFPVEASTRVIEIEGERYYHNVIRDITQHLHAEQTLRVSEERLQLALEVSGLGVWDWDVSGDELHASSTLLRMLGLGSRDLESGRAFAELLHPDDRAEMMQRWEALLAGAAPVFDAEMRMRIPTGEWKLILNRSKVVRRNGAGQALRLVGIVADLTERKNVQARLVVADRVASVASLAAHVTKAIDDGVRCVSSRLVTAHESTKRLTAAPEIGPLLEGGGERDGPESIGSSLREAQAALDHASAGCRQVRRAVRWLSTFLRSDETRPPLDVRQVLESCLDLAEGALRARASLSTDLGPVPLVNAGEAELAQVFLNILLSLGGEPPHAAAERNEIRIATRTDPLGRVLVEIRETGSAAADALGRISDPSSTVRGAVGTSLGLSISRSIVTSLGGDLQVESQQGTGSVFRVLLPSIGADSPAPGVEDRRAAVVSFETKRSR